MMPDQSRSYERLDESDLARLGRAADAVLAGGTGFASSPSRKAAPNTICAGAGASGTLTSSSALPTTRGSRAYSGARAARHVNPQRKPDLAHEPVVLIRPNCGTVAWDPDVVPRPRAKTSGHRKPHGLVPPWMRSATRTPRYRRRVSRRTIRGAASPARSVASGMTTSTSGSRMGLNTAVPSLISI